MSIKWVTRYVVFYCAALYITFMLIPGMEWKGNIFELIMLGAVMAIAFHILSPIIRLVFLPLNIVTLGLAGILVNAVIFWCALQFTNVSLTIQPWRFQGWQYNPLGIEVGIFSIGTAVTIIVASALVTAIANLLDSIV